MLLRNYLHKFDFNNTYLHVSKNNVFWESILPGTVLIIKYLDLAAEKVDVRTFLGLCIRRRARIMQSSVVLRNTVLQHAIEHLFFFNSPVILSIKAILKYKKKFRLCKLYFMRESLGITYKA